MTDTRKLKSKIVASGLTQLQIAKAIGMSGSAFNNRLHNKTEFKTGEIGKICSLFGIETEEMMSIFFA